MAEVDLEELQEASSNRDEAAATSNVTTNAGAERGAVRVEQAGLDGMRREEMRGRTEGCVACRPQ